MSNKPPVVLHRLTEAAYAELERQLLPPLADSNTTPIQAGQIIGIQLVLNKLRKGFVIPS